MQQRGFTLIELIIVIVILGILAVTAAPKFIDVQSDAQKSTLQGVKAALTSGSQLVFAKAALAGKHKIAHAGDATTEVSVNGVTVDVNFGYPDADSMTNAMLAGFVDLDTTNDWSLSTSGDSNSTASGTIVITPGSTKPANTSTNECKVVYQDATATAPPVITVTSTKC